MTDFDFHFIFIPFLKTVLMFWAILSFLLIHIVPQKKMKVTRVDVSQKIKADQLWFSDISGDKHCFSAVHYMKISERRCFRSDQRGKHKLLEQINGQRWTVVFQCWLYQKLRWFCLKQIQNDMALLDNFSVFRIISRFQFSNWSSLWENPNVCVLWFYQSNRTNMVSKK